MSCEVESSQSVISLECPLPSDSTRQLVDQVGRKLRRDFDQEDSERVKVKGNQNTLTLA